MTTLNPTIDGAAVTEAIRKALAEYFAARVHGLVGTPSVHLSPDTSWEAEGRDEFFATVTFTTREAVK